MGKKIIIVCGPTAVGKTKYAIEIAKTFNGEVVSADSMQLYKYMDIGSAKPTAEEQAMCPHHLVDCIDPKTSFSVAAYSTMARETIELLFARGKTPVIAGGTGLYVNSLMYDMDFSAPPINMDYRNQLEKVAEQHGNEFLYKILNDKNPEAAKRIHPNNVKKVIRAIEIAHSDSEKLRPFTDSFIKTKAYDFVAVGLERDREELYNRIDLRVDILIKEGLLEEVKSLMGMGFTEDDIAMKGIGYKEIITYFNGEYDLDEAVRVLKRNTRHLAKRQLTWFKRYPEIQWFNISNYEDDSYCIGDIISWLKKK